MPGDASIRSALKTPQVDQRESNRQPAGRPTEREEPAGERQLVLLVGVTGSCDHGSKGSPSVSHVTSAV